MRVVRCSSAASSTPVAPVEAGSVIQRVERQDVLPHAWRAEGVGMAAHCHGVGIVGEAPLRRDDVLLVGMMDVLKRDGILRYRLQIVDEAAAALRLDLLDAGAEHLGALPPHHASSVVAQHTDPIQRPWGLHTHTACP